MSPSPTVFAVANSRNEGCGWITWFWSSSVSLPSTSSTRWMTNITSGPPGIVLVEDDGRRRAQRPGQDALLELGDLHAVLQLDRVLADQVDAADVAVEVDAHALPVEARRHLLDMRRLAGAVIALDHDAPVVGEAGEDGERRVPVEAIGVVKGRHPLGRLGKALHDHVRVDPERLADRDVDRRPLHRVQFSTIHDNTSQAPRHPLEHSEPLCKRNAGAGARVSRG